MKEKRKPNPTNEKKYGKVYERKKETESHEWKKYGKVYKKKKETWDLVYFFFLRKFEV
jgi:hypothetical protein